MSKKDLPRKMSERSIKEQIEYCFDVSSDKKLLLQDILRLIDTHIAKLQRIVKYYIVSTDKWEHDMGEFIRDEILPMLEAKKVE